MVTGRQHRDRFALTACAFRAAVSRHWQLIISQTWTTTHAQTYPILALCIAARDRLFRQRAKLSRSHAERLPEELASTDHNRELALKIVLHVRIAGAGPQLQHQIAKIERGASEIKGTM
jgi:hypothetical protein